MFKTMTGSLDLKKNPSIEEINKIPSYIFCRWLSGNPHTIQAANVINVYDKIPVENQYKMVKTAFGGKIKYIQFPKNVSQDKLKSVEFVGLHFKVSEEKAKEYMEFISKEELNFIVEMYTEFELRGY
jgi:hypothetical protein